jgi:hypothetical protein
MPLFEPITIAFDWVHQAATLLDNELNLNGQQVRQRFEQLLQTMETRKEQATTLASGVEHFLKVTRSYAPGLFHCYDLQDLPRTNRVCKVVCVKRQITTWETSLQTR